MNTELKKEGKYLEYSRRWFNGWHLIFSLSTSKWIVEGNTYFFKPRGLQIGSSLYEQFNRRKVHLEKRHHKSRHVFNIFRFHEQCRSVRSSQSSLMVQQDFGYLYFNKNKNKFLKIIYNLNLSTIKRTYLDIFIITCDMKSCPTINRRFLRKIIIFYPIL